jgi:DNA-binding CsgD family transcriptional regulator
MQSATASQPLLKNADSRRNRGLTHTQLAIIEQIAAGRTDKEIAATLGISYRTVRTHLERLYEVNDVHCRAALVAVVAASRGRSLLSQVAT